MQHARLELLDVAEGGDVGRARERGLERLRRAAVDAADGGAEPTFLDGKDDGDDSVLSRIRHQFSSNSLKPGSSREEDPRRARRGSARPRRRRLRLVQEVVRRDHDDDHASASTLQGRPLDRHRRPERPRLQPSRLSGAEAGAGAARRPGTRRRGVLQPGVRAEPERARAPGLQPGDRRRLHGDPGARAGRQGVPEDALRDRRRLERRRGQAAERRGPALQGAGGGLPRGLRRRPRREGAGRQGRVERRRPEAAAGRPLHRGLPGRREGGVPGRPGAQRLLAGLHDPGEVQGGRAQPDRRRLGRRLPGRRWLRPRRARRCEREARVGHRRRRRPGLPRAPTS